MRLSTSFSSPEALAGEVRDQLARGGLLVRCTPPGGLDLYASVELEIACGTASVVVAATVLQVFPGIGVAVELDGAARAAIERMYTAPAAAPPPPPTARTATANTMRLPRGGSNQPSAEKIQLALHGDRDARAQVMRDPNRALHPYVLRNPAVSLDEVTAIAKMTTISVEVFKQIAERKEWGHRPEIAIALVRNATVPPAIAIALLDYVHPAELKQLAKDTRTREAIQKAARRKVIK